MYQIMEMKACSKQAELFQKALQIQGTRIPISVIFVVEMKQNMMTNDFRLSKLDISEGMAFRTRREENDEDDDDTDSLTDKFEKTL